MKKIIRKILKKALKLAGSRTFLGSLALALAIWIYVGLSSTNTVYVKIPIQFILSENQAVESIPESDISVQVRGSGWNILSLMFFSANAECLIDLKKNNSSSNFYTIQRNELIKSIHGLNKVEAINVIPEFISLKTGNIAEKEVNIVPRVKLLLKEGFVQSGDIMLKPHSVIIRGNEKSVRNLQSWFTENLTLKNIHKPVSYSIALIDSLRNMIELSQESVMMNIDIEQAAAKTISDLGFVIRGGNLPQNHVILPKLITITVCGGIERIRELDDENILVNIDLNDILYDSTGYIKPEITVPKGITVLKISPPFLHHFIRNRVKELNFSSEFR